MEGDEATVRGATVAVEVWLPDHAAKQPDEAAAVLATSGEVLTYTRLDQRSVRLANLLAGWGLGRGDHVAWLLPNDLRVFELAWAAQRSGLYYTPISAKSTTDEAAHIVRDSGARVLFVTASARRLADAVAETVPTVRVVQVDGDAQAGYEHLLAGKPPAPTFTECEGQDMLYSSGTTGRPKGVVFPLPDAERAPAPTPATELRRRLFRLDARSVFLVASPLHHAAPLRFALAVQRFGGTVVVMERFDAERFVSVVEEHRVTHTFLVPTMFSRLLRLPREVRARHDLSSLEVVVHAAAPCPIAVKERMIEWVGPKLHEYYAGTEGNGYCQLTSEEWLEHRGSVGRCVSGAVHVLDDDGHELPPGEVGTIYFEGGSPFEYHGDPVKTAESRDPLGRGWTTLGDVGRLDEDGYLYLTDRRDDVVISGGVNIYPQEVEDVLAAHPAVEDVAVIGVADEDLGEIVKAIVVPVAGAAAEGGLEAELIEHCAARLARFKCPRSVELRPHLPRDEAGKLFRRLLRSEHRSR